MSIQRTERRKKGPKRCVAARRGARASPIGAGECVVMEIGKIKPPLSPPIMKNRGSKRALGNRLRNNGYLDSLKRREEERGIERERGEGISRRPPQPQASKFPASSDWLDWVGESAGMTAVITSPSGIKN